MQKIFFLYLHIRLWINLFLALRKVYLSDEHDDKLIYLNLCLTMLNQQKNLPSLTISPSDIVALFKKLFKNYWRRIISVDKKKENRGGRPRLSDDMIHLIHQIQSENSLFSAAKIREKLLQLNILNVPARNTIDKYMKLHPDPPPLSRSGNRDQYFDTFFKNHSGTWAADLFVVPTVKFELLYVLIIVKHSTREILHFSVTYDPCAQWLRQQFREATPYGQCPKYLIHDNEPIFCSELFKRFLLSSGIKPVKTSYQSPWQNGICERAIGTIKQELIHYMIPLSRKHLHDSLKDYLHYYNHHRTHQSLDGDTPVPSIKYLPSAPGKTKLIATPVLNGLYHYYRKVA